MSDICMTYEDWLRGCVYHNGRKGNVYLPCDKVLEIADWIEAQRNAVSTIEQKRGRWIVDEDGNIKCSVCGNGSSNDNFCERCGAKMENTK